MTEEPGAASGWPILEISGPRLPIFRAFAGRVLALAKGAAELVGNAGCEHPEERAGLIDALRKLGQIADAAKRVRRLDFDPETGKYDEPAHPRRVQELAREEIAAWLESWEDPQDPRALARRLRSLSPRILFGVPWATPPASEEQWRWQNCWDAPTQIRGPVRLDPWSAAEVGGLYLRDLREDEGGYCVASSSAADYLHHWRRESDTREAPAGMVPEPLDGTWEGAWRWAEGTPPSGTVAISRDGLRFAEEDRTLTKAERRACSIAAVAASSETDTLLAIIARLSGEKIVPADEKR